MSREITYWKKTGLALGTSVYLRYLNFFGVTPDSFIGQTVCDFGCGPFGGILSVLKGVGRAYPVDTLANLYNEWGKTPFPILWVDDADCRTTLNRGSCDAVFCLNVLDHTPVPYAMQVEMARIAKVGARLYLYCHVREKTKDHYPLSDRRVKQIFAEPMWRAGWWKIAKDDINDQPSLMAIATVLERGTT